LVAMLQQLQQQMLVLMLPPVHSSSTLGRLNSPHACRAHRVLVSSSQHSSSACAAG
jgi:hypothetical protein